MFKSENIINFDYNIKNCKIIIENNVKSVEYLSNSSNGIKRDELNEFICDLNDCNKIFKLKCNLNRHKRCFHLNERQFKCDYKECNKRFNYKSNLIQHKKPFI